MRGDGHDSGNEEDEGDIRMAVQGRRWRAQVRE
jgi:hypothetical protein